MKKIALGLAAAVIATTGVASALTMSQSAHGSADQQSATLAVSNEQMAATFSAHPNVKVSDVTDLVGQLPGVSDLVSKIPGASQVDGLVDSLPSVDDIKSKVTSAIPSACGAGLPSLPLGTVLSDFGNVTGQAVAAGAGNSIGAHCSTDAADVPDVVGTVTGAVDTVKGIAGNLPLPVQVPSIASIQGSANGAVGTATSTATGAVNTATGIAGNLPALPTAGDVTSTVNGLVNTVTGTVNGLLAGLPSLSCNASGTASSGGILGGLLGNLTASVSGSC